MEDSNAEIRTTCCAKLRRGLQANWLLVLTTIAILIGFAVGIGARYAEVNETQLVWIGLPGELFMRALTLLVVPVIVSSVFTMVASNDYQKSGKIGALTFAGGLSITTLSCVLVVLLVIIARPGDHHGASSLNTTARLQSKHITTTDIITDLLRNLVPDNLMGSALYQTATEYKETVLYGQDINNQTVAVTELSRSLAQSHGFNLLGLLFCSIIFGLAASKAGEDAAIFIAFFKAIYVLVFKILTAVLWCLPLGLCSLMAFSIASAVDIERAFVSLGYFAITISGFFIFQALVLYQLINFVITRRNPYTVLRHGGRSVLTGVVATSSYAALPFVMKACEDLRLNSKVYHLSIPLGISVHAAGSASFIAAATVFVAQYSGTPLNIPESLLTAILSAIFVISLPAIPSASLITVLVLLSSFNLSTKSVSLLFATEFLLDRIRTGSNIIGNIYLAANVDQFCSDHAAEEARLNAEELVLLQNNVHVAPK